MSKFTKGSTRAMKFMKQNIYYVLMITCLLIIGTTITVTLVHQSANTDIIAPAPDPAPDPDPEPNPPIVIPDKIVFGLPVANPVSLMEYCMDSLVYNPTLEQWETHSGLDFMTEEQEDVLSVYGGEVISIITDQLFGTVITIKHNDELVSKYGSLDKAVSVAVGDMVEIGQVIGKTGKSSILEVAQGNHLHLEVWKNGEIIDPNEYLVDSSK